MASDRQKYNFLAAWVKQLDQARDEDDDLAAHVEQMVCEACTGVFREIYEGLDDLRKVSESHEERIAALEELDDDGSASPGEEPWADDDGDDDDELGGVQPQVGSVPEGHGRVAPTVAGARVGNKLTRGLSGVPERRKVKSSGSKPEAKRKKR